MPYTRKALSELQRTLENFSKISLWIEDKVSYEDFFRQKSDNQSLSQEQRNAASNLSESLADLSRKKLDAASYALRIKEYLNGGEDAHLDIREDHINSFINELSVATKNISDTAETYLIRDNYDEVPSPKSRAWNFLNVATSLKEAAIEVKGAQILDDVSTFVESREDLKKAATYQSVMMLSGADPETLERDLETAKRESEEAKRDLAIFKSDRTREEWAEKYKDAHIKIEQIPAQINSYIERYDRLDWAIAKGKKDLEQLDHLQELYRIPFEHLKRTREELAELSDQMNDNIARNKKLHNDVKKVYPELLENAIKDNTKNEIQVKACREYAAKKQSEMKWRQVVDLTIELQELFKDERMNLAKTAAFAKIGNRSEKGFEDALYTKEFHKSLVSQLLPDQRAAYEKGKVIEKKILALIPEKERQSFQQAMQINTRHPSLDITADILQEAKTKYAQAQSTLMNDPVYLENAKMKGALSSAQYLVNVNNDQLIELNKDPEKNKTKIEEVTAKRTQNENWMKDILEEIEKSPYDTDLIDTQLRQIQNSSMTIAESDRKLEQLKEKQEDLEGLSNRLTEQTAQLRKEVITLNPGTEELRDLDYQAQKQGQQNRIKKSDMNGFEGERMIEEMAAENIDDPNELFNRVRSALKSKLDMDNKTREEVAPNHIEKLRKELKQAQEDVKNYSFEVYKETLIDKDYDAKKAERKVERLTAMNAELGKMKASYNEYAKRITGAGERLDDMKAKLLESIEAFKKNYVKDKKWKGDDSDEYKAILTELNKFTKDTIKTMSPEQIKDNLRNLAAASNQYLEEKKSQNWYHWFPTSQRKYRIAYAGSIADFAEKQARSFDSLGITTKIYQDIEAAKQNPPQVITEDAEFAKKAKELALAERENPTVQKFKSFSDEINRNLSQKMTEADYTTDEERKEWAKKAIASGEVEKELWKVKAGQEGLHVDAMKELQRKELENAEKYSGKDIDKAVKQAHVRPKMTAWSASYYKNCTDLAREYNNIPSYNNIAEVVKQNANEMKKEGKSLFTLA